MPGIARFDRLPARVQAAIHDVGVPERIARPAAEIDEILRIRRPDVCRFSRDDHWRRCHSQNCQANGYKRTRPCDAHGWLRETRPIDAVSIFARATTPRNQSTDEGLIWLKIFRFRSCPWRFRDGFVLYRHGKRAGNIAAAASCRPSRAQSYLVLAFGDDRSRSLAFADEAATQAQACDHQHQG